MRFYSSVLFSLLPVFSAGAQDGSVSMPSLGFAFDSNLAAIRPIRGIPGAALVADPLDAGFPIRAAFIAPLQDFALAAPADDSPLRLIRFQTIRPGLQNSSYDLRPLDGALSSPDRAVFSPSGHSAVLYASGGRAQILTGLPDQPAMRDLETAGAAPMAISDDGSLVVVDGIVLNAGGSPSSLSLPLSTVAVAFRGNSRDFLAVTTNGDVYLIRDAEARLVYSGDEQTAEPVAIQFSPDGARAYTATARGALSTIDLGSGSLTSVSCGCRAAALEPLNSRGLFRVTSVSRPPLQLFDVSGSEPRVWFVPSAERSNQ
jgi:hypothetical protein